MSEFKENYAKVRENLTSVIDKKAFGLVSIRRGLVALSLFGVLQGINNRDSECIQGKIAPNDMKMVTLCGAAFAVASTFGKIKNGKIMLGNEEFSDGPTVKKADLQKPFDNAKQNLANACGNVVQEAQNIAKKNKEIPFTVERGVENSKGGVTMQTIFASKQRGGIGG